MRTVVTTDAAPTPIRAYCARTRTARGWTVQSLRANVPLDNIINIDFFKGAVAGVCHHDLVGCLSLFSSGLQSPLPRSFSSSPDHSDRHFFNLSSHTRLRVDG